MRTIDVFEKNNFSDQLIKEYIATYLKIAVGYKIAADEIQYKKINFDNHAMYVVILKDDIRRIDIKSGGSGVLRQRQWSVFVFNFIDSCQYIKFFGRNNNKKEITAPFNSDSCEEFFFEDIQTKYNGTHPDRIYSSRNIKHLLHNYVFCKLFNKYRFLFLNSYVYSVIGIINSSTNNIEEKGFSTFYYNTNHVFRQVPYKKIINQRVDINKTSYLVEKIDDEFSIIEKNYNDMADLVNAYNGHLSLNSVTSLNYNSIDSDIKSKENFIITEGMARTGKTVIAMRILGAYSDAKAVIMNPYFYKSLKEIFNLEKIPFPSDRIACHTEFDKTESIMKDSAILVIDEAQRLNESQIDNILSFNSSNINVFLGDNLQKLNKKFDKGISVIENKIKDRGYDYKKYYFNHSIGISNNVLYSIKYLLFNNVLFRGQNVNKYEINIFDRLSSFKEKYINDSTFRKHMATVYMGYGDYDVTIDGFTRWKVDKLQAYPYFLDKDVKEYVMLTTYEMISRELDSIYIYLPKTISANETGLHYLYEESDEYLLNQIYVLMTRAKGGINVYCEDVSVYNYLTTRYNNLIKSDNGTTRLTKEELEKSRQIEAQIEERGITRLIHFTSIDNVESIYDNGLMSTFELNKRGIKYDCNDTVRCDNVSDGISLSVQNPNEYLLHRFKQKYPNKKYVFLILDPALLYEITDDSNEKLASRYYCNYNAASYKTKRSEYDLQIMFEDSFNSGSWVNTRIDKEDCDTTTNQAEILFRHTINPKYILEVVEDD